jgi:hypothetical protein
MPNDLLRKARVIAAGDRVLATLTKLVDDSLFDRGTLSPLIDKLQRVLFHLGQPGDLAPAETTLKEVRSELLRIMATSRNLH